MTILRRTLRYVHAALSVAIGAFVYSPTLRADPSYLLLIQTIVFPAIAAAGSPCGMDRGWRAHEIQSFRKGPRQLAHITRD